MTLIAVMFVPVILMAAISLLHRTLRIAPAVQGAVAAAGLAAAFAAALVQLQTVSADGAWSWQVPWVPQLGLTFSVYADGLALLFVLLITGIGTAVTFYTGFYFEDDGDAARFLVLLLAFTGSMLALVLAGNVLTLFIAWELTSITSFLLIGFYGADDDARRGALQALMVTGAGGLALLVGLLVMGSAAETLELAELLASGDLLRSHPWYGGFVILILLGAFSKSAQFPLHFWLPGAMSAPTPASAFLHSATMVKAGVYLVARLSPILGDTILWTTALAVVGLITMALGALLAMRQRDLKALLAYSTISQLGALVALIGLPHGEGIKAAMVGILAHGLYKCALFLVVGAVDHATGTRDITRLGGLRHRMPGFARITGIAALSMAGVPPLFGFVSKELLIESYATQTLGLGVVVFSAALTVAAALRLFWDVFMDAQPTADHHQDAPGGHPFHPPPRLLAAGPGLLAALSVIAGLGIGPLITPLVEPAVGKPVTLYLLPPYGITLTLILSLGALAAGGWVFAARHRWLAWSLPPLLSGTQVYQTIVGAVESAADFLLRSQAGKIRYYLVVILTAVVVLLTTALVQIVPAVPSAIQLTNVSELLKLVLLGLALVATTASVIFKQHLAAALSLGIAGYAIGGIFLLEPAPDVALVQFLVETLATVLIILVLVRTSAEERQRVMATLWKQSPGGLTRDILLSGAIGTAMAVFALVAVSSRPTPNTIAAWHLENALPLTGVTDVVASIVTDFRGTDTLIEITVFAIASLGVLTLFTRPEPGRTTRFIAPWRRRRTSEMPVVSGEEALPSMPVMYRSRFEDPITQTTAALVLPFAFIIAVAHILYAGVAPGDGFTAGVIIGLAIALWFVVFGYEDTKARLRWLRPTQITGVGLTIAFANALLPLAFGGQFLAHSQLSGIDFADIKLASSLVFEIGISLTVFGGISNIMEAISHPRESEPL